jgi:hypothetical protein
LRDLAAFIPDCVTTVRRLRKNPRVPRKAEVAILIAEIWVAFPIDLIPEFIPVIATSSSSPWAAVCRPSGPARGTAGCMAGRTTADRTVPRAREGDQPGLTDAIDLHEMRDAVDLTGEELCARLGGPVR